MNLLYFDESSVKFGENFILSRVECDTRYFKLINYLILHNYIL